MPRKRFFDALGKADRLPTPHSYIFSILKVLCELKMYECGLLKQRLDFCRIINSILHFNTKNPGIHHKFTTFLRDPLYMF